jgi:arabinan endo-1,5-alpha-L-arabinosidase
MASRPRRLAACALLLGVWGCQGATDIVATAATGYDAGSDLVAAHDVSPDFTDTAYGDYNPDAPPKALPLGGDISVTDPALFRWQDTYWVFSTGPGISVRSSKDLATFQLEKPVFAQNPAWIAQQVPEAVDLWSPAMLAWGGTIHLYYAASNFNLNKGCIGHATTTSLDQPFEDKGSVICSNVSSSDPFTAIDPAVVLDAAGDPWLAFGSWGSGIQLVALDRSGNRRDTNIYPIAARQDGGGIQAACLYRWRDYYYLFASYDSSPKHILRVGRAKDVKGEYVDRDGKSMKEGGGTAIWKVDARYKGPGSNMVFDDTGRRLNVYHAYDSNQSSTSPPPVLRISELVFDNAGWPVSGGP